MFNGWDECTSTGLSVFAATGVEKVKGGRKTDVALVQVRFESYDYCTDTYRSASGEAELNRGEFSVGSKLESATLTKTLWLNDYMGGFTLGLSIVWTGDGPLVRVRESEQIDGDGYKVKLSLSGSFRNATPEVVVSVDGKSLEMQGYFGRLVQARQGRMVIVQDNKRPPSINHFYAEPEVVVPGESATLHWSVDDRRAHVRIEPDIGPVPPEGSVTVTPTETTTYTLTATNRNGSVSYPTTVYVLTDDPYEPNDAPADATPISLYSYMDGLTLLSGDVDWFSFSLSETTYVFASLWSQNLSLVSALFDTGLNELARGNDWEQLEIVLPPGEYFLAVSAVPDTNFTGDHTQQGFYELYLGGYEP